MAAASCAPANPDRRPGVHVEAEATVSTEVSGEVLVVAATHRPRSHARAAALIRMTRIRERNARHFLEMRLLDAQPRTAQTRELHAHPRMESAVRTVARSRSTVLARRPHGAQPPEP